MRNFGRNLLAATFGLVAVSVIIPAPAGAHDGSTQYLRTAVSAGFLHTCAVQTDARVWCWGNNTNGAVTGTVGGTVKIPTAVPTLDGVVSVAAGYEYSCALRTDGGVACWGSNAFGQLGGGSTGGIGVPLPVVGITDAVAISAGASTTCALRASGSVRCWGFGDHGALGNGAKSDSNVPVPVSGITNATEVSVGTSYACARLATGAVKCWGAGTDGQLGDGNAADSTTPVSVSGVTTASTVSAGASHACVVLASLDVRCWGNNNAGSLGDGTNNTSNVPVAPQFAPKAITISAGYGFTCGRAIAGMSCWGANGSGQLGVGNTSASNSPLGVTGANGAFFITTGGSHTCIASGGVWCWGDNSAGQLGDGTLNPATLLPAQPIAGLNVTVAVSTAQPVAPERLLDTRPTSPVAYNGAKPGAGATVTVQVTGTGKAQLPAGTPAAVLNVTGTEASAQGFVTVWPCDATRPVASTLNLVPGQDRANAAIVRLSATGTVCLYTQSGAHLVVDLAGHVPATTAYVAVDPTRVLDTRPPVQIGYSGAKPGVGSVVTLQITGTSETNIPLGAGTAVLNVTATEATDDGYVTVWPCDEARPTASNLNVRRNDTLPVGVIAKLSAAGTVCLYSQSGTHLVADLNGWMPPGGSYKPTTPQRVLDTRPDSLVGFSGAKPAADDVVTVSLAPVADLPTVKATSVVLSVTATEADGDAFITVWSCIGPRPLASNVNVPAGGTRPNLVLTGVNSGSTICVSASRSTHLIVDVNGWIPNGATTTIERG